MAMKKISPLRRYRLKKQISTKQLACFLGLAESTVRSLENGTRKFTAEQAVHIETKTGEVKRRDLRPDLFA